MVIRPRVFFFLPQQSQKSRSVVSDRSRSLGLFRKGKTRITAKFQRTNLVICSHSGKGKMQFYSRVNMVLKFNKNYLALQQLFLPY